MFDGKTYRAGYDYERLANALQKVLWIMLDGEWHSLDELRRRVSSSADSRLRDLRKQKFGAFEIQAARAPQINMTGDNGTYYYRISSDEYIKQRIECVIDSRPFSISRKKDQYEFSF